MISIEGLCKSFGNRAVLKHIDLKIHRGRIRVILGLSGSGKSVLMKHIIGLLQPDSGCVRVDGENMSEAQGDDLLRLRRNFGMVFQQSALFDSMTIADNIAFPLREHTKLTETAIEEKVLALLNMLGLPDIRQQYPSELSGGMRKRVGLARAVILEASCVLYDEPTTGLDPISTQNIDHMILEAKEKLQITSVVISHDIGSTWRIADDIAVLHEGEIVWDGPKHQLKQANVSFIQSYLAAWDGH